MPIDTGIYDNLIRPPQPLESPVTAMTKAADLQSARLDAQAKMRSAQEDAQIRQVFQESGTDMAGAIQKVATINPTKAAKIQETWDQSRKAHAELVNSQIDHLKKVNELAGQALALYDPKDPSSWGHTQAAMTATYMAGNLPLPQEYQGPPPDEATLNRWKLSSVSVEKQLEANKKHYEKDTVTMPGQDAPVLAAFDPQTGQRLVRSPTGEMVEAVGATGKEPEDKVQGPEIEAIKAFTTAHSGRKPTEAELDQIHRRYKEAGTIVKVETGSGASPDDVKSNVQTTVTGKPYVDLGDYETPKARQAARQAAQKEGLTVVDKATGQSLRAADTARLNINAMWNQIKGKLPKDAQGRLTVGAGNKLSAYFQTDADLAAFNSWRAGAIQAVQALVERGMGFRMNKTEIDMIMENDMPQITDDVQTAYRRVKNVITLLNDKESVALNRDRSTLGQSAKVNPYAR